MNEILDKYTLAFINKIIEAKKYNLHKVEHNSLDFLDGYLYALLWVQEEIGKLHGSQKKKD